VCFSSRRRHTSSKRDWSSDVCSSDLRAGAHRRVDRLLRAVPAALGGRMRTLRRAAQQRLWSGVAVALALIWIFPVYWILNGALQPAEALRSPTPSFLPTNFTLDAFGRALDDQ